MKPRLLFYSQHVLGFGHLVRSLEIIRHLTEFEVCFLNGGQAVPQLEYPEGVEVIHLPAMQASEDFQQLRAVESSGHIDDTRRLRTKYLLQTLDRWQPAIVILELFPFGRSQFTFELLPLLARIRRTLPNTRVICSLRDILVTKDDRETYEERVCRITSRYLDAVYVHADRQFQRLEETFSRVEELGCPVTYTGYVVQAAQGRVSVDMSESAGVEPVIVASIGGGRVGVELLQSTIRASQLVIGEWPHRLHVYGGPFLPEPQLIELQAEALNARHIRVSRFTADLVDEMSCAALSISMAGYNTCMNILTARVPALVLPFAGGGNDEQSTRARRLEALGALRVLEVDDLAPARLAQQMMEGVALTRSAPALDLEGGPRTAQLLQQIGSSTSIAGAQRPPLNSFMPSHLVPSGALRELRSELVRFAEHGKTGRVFLRDDDVDVDSPELRTLLDICLALEVPISLELVPGRLERSTSRWLKTIRRHCQHQFQIDQHGWMHTNHEQRGKKCEFGMSRSYEAQFQDIARGKAILSDTFGDSFYHAFTPPWNRCTADTFQVLEDLRFRVLSRHADGIRSLPATGFSFCEVPVTLDLFSWRDGPSLRDPRQICEDLKQQMESGEPIGLLLHHHVMNSSAFDFLQVLLEELRACPAISFHTIGSLAACVQFT